MKDPELAIDQSKQAQQQSSAVGVLPNASQMSYGTLPYQTAPMVAAGTPVAQPFPHQQMQEQQQQLQMFWDNQMRDVEQTTDFKNHSLPLARIKKIMKADEDVRMISAEAPVIFAKACEMFILELTLRSWLHTEENKRRTLQKNDIAAAISRTDVFDFLVDIMPRDELKEEGLGLSKAALPIMGSPGDSFPYYYMPPQHPGMLMGNTGDQSTVYGGQQLQPQPLAYMPWPQQQTQQQTQQPETDS